MKLQYIWVHLLIHSPPPPFIFIIKLNQNCKGIHMEFCSKNCWIRILFTFSKSYDRLAQLSPAVEGLCLWTFDDNKTNQTNNRLHTKQAFSTHICTVGWFRFKTCYRLVWVQCNPTFTNLRKSEMLRNDDRGGQLGAKQRYVPFESLKPLNLQHYRSCTNIRATSPLYRVAKA